MLILRKNKLKKRIKAVAVFDLALVLMLTQTGCGRLSKEPGNESEERLNASVIAETIEESSEDSGEENSEKSGDETDAAALEEETNIAPQLDREGYRTDIILGDERTDIYIPLLTGKNVAVFSNNTGIVGDDTDKNIHIVDGLIESGISVSLIFSPEHGFRGNADAGESVSDGIDEKTGVTIVSLYGGSSSALSADNMSKFDTLVVDIQDVGLRFYTYYITMCKLMDACAQYEKEVIILDRPNPNGFYVDGPILKDGFKSGVGSLPITTVHGMTLGELALMINGEGWLPEERTCALTVVPCENYSHKDFYRLVNNPSPNLRSMRAIYLYSSLCYFENTVVSVGRGTDNTFEIYGSPEFENADGYDFVFTPESNEGAKNPQYMGRECFGRDLSSLSLHTIRTEGINLDYLIDCYTKYKEINPDGSFFGKPDANGHYWIDLLFGTDEVRKMIEEGRYAREIEESWTAEIKEFKSRRSEYLLYEDAD